VLATDKVQSVEVEALPVAIFTYPMDALPAEGAAIERFESAGFDAIEIE